MLTKGWESFGPLTMSCNVTKELTGVLVYTSLSVTLVSMDLLVREQPFWVQVQLLKQLSLERSLCIAASHLNKNQWCACYVLDSISSISSLIETSSSRSFLFDKSSQVTKQANIPNRVVYGSREMKNVLGVYCPKCKAPLFFRDRNLCSMAFTGLTFTVFYLGFPRW